MSNAAPASPASSGIPLSVPEISGNEWNYVKECLDTGWVSSVGAFVDRFEKEFAAKSGSARAVAAVNGTSALHLALRCLGVGPGDEVVVPSLTFIAPANAVRYCFAEPVFLGCDPDTLCIAPAMLASLVNERYRKTADGGLVNKSSGRALKAVIPVHIFGHPSDMDALSAALAGTNVAIIEDATESLGSLYKGRPTGSIGLMGCFSFNGNKIITTGGGGMLTTSSTAIAARAKHLSTQAKCDPMEYDHDDIGYNYRLPNLLAAMGCAQLERIDEFVSIKRKNAALYRDALSGIDGLEMLWEQDWAQSNFWFYTLRLDSEKSMRGLLASLNKAGCQSRPLWKPLHALPMYSSCASRGVESVIDAYSRCLNIPCSVGLKESDLEYVAATIKAYMRKA